MMDPGRFREPMAFQAPVRTPDGAGGFVETWTDVPEWSQLFAEIAPLRSSEQILGQQVTASITHRVRMWAIEGVSSTQHRIRRHLDNVVMEIVTPPLYDPERLTMEMLAHERVAP